MSTSVKPFDEYPILGYKFDVVFIINGNNFNCAFQTISGLSKSTKTTKIHAGGDYFNEYLLPNTFSYKQVVFKRGVLRNFGDNRNPSFLQSWFENLGWINGYKIETATVEIHVKDFDKNKKRVTVETFALSNAYPTTVTLGELNSQKSEVLIETINLGFSSYSRINKNK
jgi:phage tail-like protein